MLGLMKKTQKTQGADLWKQALDGLDAVGVLLDCEASSPDFTSWTTADDLDKAREALDVLKRVLGA